MSELKELGVSAQQIITIEKALVFVRGLLVPPAANNETLSLLRDVEKSACKLAQKLRQLGTPSNEGGQNSARQKAANLLASGYWDTRPMDEGPTIIGAFCPRLEALADAAISARDSVPKAKPARYKAADPEPVRRIDYALVEGWQIQHRSSTVWLDPAEQTDLDAAIAAHVSICEKAQPYPENLLPSASLTSAFWRIVGICYATVGRNANPERAIKAYVASESKRYAQSIAEATQAFRQGVESVTPPQETERSKKS